MSALLLRQEDSWLHAIAVMHACVLVSWRVICMLMQSVGAVLAFFVLYVDVIKLAFLFNVRDVSINALYCMSVFAIATLAGVAVAGATFPASWRARGTQLCIALALAYPLSLYALSGADDAIRLYLPLYAMAVLGAGFFAASIMGVASMPVSVMRRVRAG